MVMKFLSSAAFAASLALAVPVLAEQAPTDGAGPSPAPAAQSPTPAPSAASATAAGVNASATVGMPVTDSTGAAIGQITAIDPDSTGKTMATVKMGAQSFSVDASALAVQGGTAKINETKAQIQQQMPKS
jgi:hypothetical protein